LGIAIRECLSHPFIAVQRLIAAVFIGSEIDPQHEVYVGIHLVPNAAVDRAPASAVCASVFSAVLNSKLL
jgi:hypothetical protein